MSTSSKRALEYAQEEETILKKGLPKENIFKSLAAFQQECQVIHKGTKGYGYSYADLPTIFSVINPLLKKHNLGFTQLLDGTELRTILFHTKSGESIEASVVIPQNVQLKGMNAFQVYGSAITYFRRYALSSLLGIITDKDTDASGEQVKPTLDEATFFKAIDAIKKGSYKKEQLVAKYSLSNKQKQTLELC